MVYQSWSNHTLHSLRSLFVFALILLLLCSSFAPPSTPPPAAAADGTTFYVKTSGGSSNSCTDWNNACDLQTALSNAIAGDEIWVAAGVYTPGTYASDTFTLKNGVALYGGFTGNESNRNDRDWETNLTILSGDIDENDTTDTNGIVTDTDNIKGTNAYHVVTGEYQAAQNTVIDGFVITAGMANEVDPFAHSVGGGLYNEHNSLTLKNLIFSGNFAAQNGGGMVNYRSNPTLTNVTFSNNVAGWNGGGISIYSSNPTLTNVVFNGNTAISEYGGGMENFDGNPTLQNVIFSNNSAACGGGMDNFDSNPTLINVTFSNNTATSGGAMNNNTSSPRIQNSIFWGNTANAGDQIMNSSSTTVISSTLIQGSGGSGASWDTSLGTDNGNNLDILPQFVDADAGDYRLQPGSPAMDTGDNTLLPADTTTDLDGNSRIVNGTVDMGAYEVQTTDDTTAPTVSIDQLNTTDQTPPLSGEVDDGNATIAVAVDGSTYAATNKGDGTWTLPDDTITPALSNATYDIAVTATDSSGNVGSDSSSDELRVNTEAQYWYVTEDGSSSDTCKDWANACDLQTALRNASYIGSEIWVAAGLYTPGSSPTDTFTLTQGVSLYGGFAGHESKRQDRDWETNLTILSGDIEGNDTTDANGIVTDTDNIQDTNAYHVVTSSRVNSSTVLDGFVITAGSAFGSNYPEDIGGGMLNNESSPTLRNLRFIGNTADYNGGGMSNYSASNPILTNITFSNNRAAYGGGMSNYSASNPTLFNVRFRKNTAGWDGGGGMHNEHSDPTLVNVLFDENAATREGGGINNVWSSPTLVNVTVSNNTAATNGGGMTNQQTDSQPIIQNSIFWGNTASDEEDQIYNAGGTAFISSTLIQGSGASGANWDTSLGTDNGNNLDTDPSFVDADAGNYRLQSGSPAIDAGDNALVTAGITTDLEGTLRILDGDSDEIATVDMGAYEADFIAPTVGIDPLTTNDPTPALTGSIDEPNATVQLTLASQTYTATNHADGTWTLADDTISPALATGTYAITLTATDIVGNIGNATATNGLVIDLTAPTVGVDPLTTDDATPPLSGTVDDRTATVQVTVSGSTYTATNNGDGTWTLADDTLSPALAAGTYDLTITATDTAGNSASATATGGLVIALNDDSNDDDGDEPGDDTSDDEPGDDTSGDEPGDDTSDDEPGDDTPADDTPADDTPADDTPADDTPADDTPADDTPADDTPADDTPADDTPADDTPADDTPADDTPADDTPADDTPGNEEPGNEEPGDEQPRDDEPNDEPDEEQPDDEPAEEPREEEPREEDSDDTEADDEPGNRPGDAKPDDETDDEPGDTQPDDETDDGTDHRPGDETPGEAPPEEEPGNRPDEQGTGADVRVAPITPDEGGTITTTTGMRITFPQGAVTLPVTVTCTRQTTPAQHLPAKAIGLRFFTLEAHQKSNGRPVTTFTKPLTIEIAYTDEDVAKLAAQNLAATDMVIVFWNGKVWEALTTEVDVTRMVVIARVDHFTQFALMTQPAEEPNDVQSQVFLPFILR